jgi:hypothetical protein
LFIDSLTRKNEKKIYVIKKIYSFLDCAHNKIMKLKIRKKKSGKCNAYIEELCNKFDKEELKVKKMKKTIKVKKIELSLLYQNLFLIFMWKWLMLCLKMCFFFLIFISKKNLFF